MVLRYALRMLAKNPVFTGVAVLSLALGIGANTLVFTIVHALFLRSLPVRDPQQLVALFATDVRIKGLSRASQPVSYPNFKDFQERNEVFSGLAAYQYVPMALTGAGQPEQISGQIVTGNYFDVLGVRAILGRTFLPEEDKTLGTHPVVVLSGGLWKTHYGSDPGIVGKTVIVDGRNFTVIGVTAEDFRGSSAIGGPDLWVPMMMHQQVLGRYETFFNERSSLLFFAVGRLMPGIIIDQGRAGMKILARALESEYPVANEGRSTELVPINEAAILPRWRGNFLQIAGLMTTVVALVLLIACGNVANLLLARAGERSKEIAIRIALGAGPMRLVRQLLTESTLLAVFGAALGLVLAYWGRNLLWAYRPSYIDPEAIDLSFSFPVLAFTGLVSLVTAAMFGLVPALQAVRPDVSAELKDTITSGGQGFRRFSLSGILVVSQVAFSLVALIASGLFLASLVSAQKIDPGFEVGRLAVLSYDLGAQGYSVSQGTAFHRQVLERVSPMAGVASATLGANLPLIGGGQGSTAVPEGQDPKSGQIIVRVQAIGPRYFETLGIPLLQGRSLSTVDREKSPLVAVINQTAARRFWPGQDANGKRFQFVGQAAFYQVVGVVKDSEYNYIGEDPQPYVFYPLSQHYTPAMTLFVRSDRAPALILGDVRREVQKLDATMPLVKVQTMEATLRDALWAPRLGAVFLSGVGALALLLAAIGVYGVTAYSVARRKREIGIRMALGANRTDVLKLVVGQGMTLALVGVGIGVLAALSLRGLVKGLLYGVNPGDPAIYAGISLLLLAVALLACYFPARRATRVDPLVALRHG